MEESVIDKEREKVVSRKPLDSDYQWSYREPQSQPQPQTPSNKMKWDDFLNPRSMLTPGIAGSMVMLIANTLWVQFTIPQKWTALFLSFLIIVPILIKFSASLFENIIYFIFNGLIVFAMAVNTNFVGAKIEQVSQNPTPRQPVVTQRLNTYPSNTWSATITPQYAARSENGGTSKKFFSHWF